MNSKCNYILFDDRSWEQLLPLTFTRPVADIRIGILKIREKWEHHFKTNFSYQTKDYLQKKYPLVEGKENVFINGSVLPDIDLVKAISFLKMNQILKKDHIVIAFCTDNADIDAANFLVDDTIEYSSKVIKINYPWDIFLLNGNAINDDFDLVTNGRRSQTLSSTVNVIQKDKVFVEEGAKLEYVTLNASAGPIYIGKNSEIMEGTVVRGALALCEESTIRLGAKIYGPTTIGPYCKVGGEISNSIIFGYANKSHDGYLGNSVLGEWCNIGADTNCSNLKNNYAIVKVWSYIEERFIDTGLQFCGLIMGDHSKCGINTMFNTGTVVGVNVNIFGSGFPRNFVPSFSWGGSSKYVTYTLKKAFETTEIVMKRRGLELNETEKEILTKIFNSTEKYRNF